MIQTDWPCVEESVKINATIIIQTTCKARAALMKDRLILDERFVA